MLERLDEILQNQIPGASVKIQRLAQARNMKMALIDPDFDDSNLSQEIQNRLMDDPPYWIFCWASGHALAELMLDGSIDVKGKTVLDFGAGGGAGAIAAKLAGAKKVYACDIDLIGCEVCSLNAELNDVDIQIIHDVKDAGAVDLLIAADVLYERANYWFLDMFLNVAPEILVADSRLKTMPNDQYSLWRSVNTTSYPDFHEALEFNTVNFYQAKPE